MGLKLPDGRMLSQAQAAGAIADYRQQYPAVLDLYDLPGGGPRDEVSALDILAVNALNGFGLRPPLKPMTELWLNRQRVESAVAPITTTGIELLADSELAQEAPKLALALDTVGRIPGFSDTSSSQLIHRLRPNLTPIWDERIDRWYGRSGGWLARLERVHAQVRAPHNLSSLLTIRDALDVHLPILRLWDVILWQLAPVHVG